MTHHEFHADITSAGFAPVGGPLLPISIALNGLLDFLGELSVTWL